MSFAPRRTGNEPPQRCRISRATGGRYSSSLAMNISGRGATAIRTTGSARLRWLETTRTPPEAGRCSRPDTLARVKAAFTAMQNARIGAYSGPGFQPTFTPASSDGESVDRPADTGSGITGSRRNQQIDLLDHLVDRHAVGLDNHGV